MLPNSAGRYSGYGDASLQQAFVANISGLRTNYRSGGTVNGFAIRLDTPLAG